VINSNINLANIEPGNYINQSGKMIKIWAPGEGNQRDKLANIQELAKGGYTKMPEIPLDKKTLS